MKRKMTSVALVGLLAAALSACGGDGPAVSADSEQAASAAQTQLASAGADGKALYAACQACHGAGGEGNASMNAPSLVNQDAWYVKRQLLAFKSGVRGSHEKDVLGAQMKAIAANLADEAAVDALVGHIDGLRNKTPEASVKGDLKRGEDYYSMVCGSCHGPKAEGNELLDAPALAGVDDWYLLRQFENFRGGIRGAHPEDRFGRQMVMMAPALPDEAITRDVVAYIQSLAD